LAKILNGKISRRELSDRILGLGLGMATVESVLDTVTPAKAESFRPEPFSERTPYEQWMAKEGVPVHTGYSTPNVRTLEVKPWARVGANGALVDLTGAEGTDGAYILQLAQGETTKPQRYLFEESVFVLDGEGETTIWQDGGAKRTFRWRKGGMFSPPLNTWRQHSNRGTAPARLISFNDLPLTMDIFHSADFLFNNDFVFRERYNNDPDYFSFRPSNVRPGGTPAMFSEGEKGSTMISDTGFIPDINAVRLQEAKSRGAKNKGMEIVFSDNTMQTHISEFETGSYKRAHRHGPGSHVMILGGVGYTLMWTDNPQYSKASKHMRVDWTEGTLLVPPDRWFHQHFNGGGDSAKYMATTWIGGKYFAKGMGGGGRTHRLNTISTNQGGNMVDYPDEDPMVRSMFEEELKKHGVKSQMPTYSGGKK
jgi:quercetin dioxygenase-like cupin family protein